MVGARWPTAPRLVFTDFLFEDGFARPGDRRVPHPPPVGPHRPAPRRDRDLSPDGLLAFPVAKEVGRMIGTAEQRLADLMDRTAAPHARRRAQRARRPHHHGRRGRALGGPHHLPVRRRPGLSQPGDAAHRRTARSASRPADLPRFMERRLLPAMNTCGHGPPQGGSLQPRGAATASSCAPGSRSSWNARTRTWPDELPRQIQLHLQETVEGLSVVAITYYASQLVQYLSPGASKHQIEPLTPKDSPPRRSRSSRCSSPSAPAG